MVVRVTRFSFIIALYRNTLAAKKQLEIDSTLSFAEGCPRLKECVSAVTSKARPPLLKRKRFSL